MSSSFVPPQSDPFMSPGTLGNTSFGLSAALGRASSPSIQQWTCPCLNIRLSLASSSSPRSAHGDRSPWLAELASDSAIHVQFPSLTSRETVSLAENTNIACAKCLNCDTVVYAASKPAPPGPNRSLGFNTSSSNTAGASSEALKEAGGPVSPTAAKQYRSPSRDSAVKADCLGSRSNEPLVRPIDRKVWILPDALSPEQASSAAGSEAFSPAFNVLISRTGTLQREEALGNGATVAAVDDLRDATPTRPAVGASNRQSSYGSSQSNIAYALPAVPQHLITSPPASPRVGAPPSSSASANANSSPAPPSNASGALGSSSNPLFATNPLANQLDSVAIERLKDMRSKAEAEVFELVRQKRREMELLEKRFREEAQSLLAVTKTPRQNKTSTSNGSTASLIEKALSQQQQQQQQTQQSTTSQPAIGTASAKQSTAVKPSAAAPSANATSTSSAGPREISTAQSSVSSSGRRDSLYDEYSDLPPSAFERRPTYANAGTSSTAIANGGAQHTVASSLGGLSASFAMRGRDLPTQMQDWAEKRRLRERYPQGDHSALPSAANSTANSAANSIVDSEEDAWLAQAGGARPSERRRTRESSVNTEDDAEMERRGRGRQPSRQRGGSLSREPREPRLAQEQEQRPDHTAFVHQTRLSEPREEIGRGRAGRSSAGTFNPPPAMSSSLLTKRPALAYVDDGRDADENTPSVGGKLISPHSVAEPSAQVTLRPRDPPPSTAEPLKPATRSTAEDGSRGRGTGSSASSDPTAAAGGRGPDSPRSRKQFEKKVAFAETEDRVDHNIASDEYDDEADEEEAEGPAQRSKNGSLSSRVADASLPLVDESADAVFEIDEETEDIDGDEDGNNEATQASPEDDDRHKVEMSQSGLRTGASGRPRGQADDALPGFEDEAADHASGRRGPSSGSLSDDFRSSSDDDEDAVAPGFGAASFSALAASQSAMHTLASSMARARLDDASFDPASLRMDGRVVVPPPSTNRDLEVESEPFVVGSLRSSSRRMSVQLPSGTAASNRTVGEAADNAQGQMVGSVSGGARHQRSSSRTRISNMSKEDADTEVRLSGLLAPNAPSHRSLWSPKEAKARRAGKHKYKLNEEDNQKWDLWKRKVGSGDASASGGQAAWKDGDDKNDSGRSNPMAVAPPTQYIAAGSGIGPRPLREATMIDPDYSTSTTTAFSAFDRHLQARAAAEPAATTGGVSIGKKTWGYGSSFKDDTSGFETEPKTSLPYKEKMMVPSYRKAVRRSIFEPEASTKLATIPDADDAPTSISVGKTSAPSAAPTQPIARETSTSAKTKDADSKGALPGSVITRGFHMPGASGSATSGSETPKPSLAPASVPLVPMMATGLGLPSISTSGKSTVVPGEHATRDASVGPSLPNSGTATPTSIGRRSPRPPYVAPPPPTSASTVLQSDPSQAPRPLKMFQTPADSTFRLHEEGEEPETDEGWAKVLKFMHVVEQLKTNKRTGWMHHRVPAPESIADHMYRMAILSLLCPAESDVDLGKCVQLAVVHDLAEAEVGDLTPLDGVNKTEKMRREKEAIQYFVHDLLGSNAAGLRIEALWEEYEARETKESKLVKDLDRFELGLQAVEYERRYGIDDLQGFWEGSVPHIGHPRIRRWAEELVEERAELWRERGKEYVQERPKE
ncbi:uncharacterized protein UTRI_00481_B [Ustilago trichophora]|uniref:5'-deoxynucleotidase n=1 Tax=Ustilago trichophora TaxID=86804 RepID=A0A5C3DS91_9BASI|nr:uncharacterized protein UTRI_00481_B [Ustilago trichophora]